MTESSDSARAGTDRVRLNLYVLPFVLFPILLLMCAFLIVPTRWFEMRSGNTYLANMGYGAKLWNQNCQVLVFGDSTAMVGVDPELIHQRTGLTACNIAEFEGMTLVNGTSLVDVFLSHNPRPAYMVFLYAPEDLSMKRTWASESSFEAISFRLEYVRNFQTFLVLARHPDETFAWAEQGMRLALQRIHRPPISDERARIREATRGQLRVSGPSLTACDNLVKDIPPDLPWIRSLRSRYGVAGTEVIVDATPLPPCEPSLAYFQKNLNGVVDDTPYPLIPVNAFIADGRLHTGLMGSHLITAMVADQIVAKQAAIRPPIGPTARGR